jgi:hypothetical protein
MSTELKAEEKRRIEEEERRRVAEERHRAKVRADLEESNVPVLRRNWPGRLLAVLSRLSLCAAVLLGLTTSAEAQEDRGFLFNERFFGSSSTLGSVMRLDTQAGYQFSKHFGFDMGLPVYFVRPSATTTAAVGATTVDGIGNVYLDLRFTLLNPFLNYGSLLTGSAPTGDKSAGLSTGRATFDWTNQFNRSFSRLTPFANLGFANTVTDTPLFVRPYTTLGFVTHIDGGATYRVARFLDVTADAYGIEPAGQQTVLSKLVRHGTTSSATRASASANSRPNHGVFETTAETVGSADLVRDHGFSFAGAVHFSRIVTLQAGYTRSIGYDLNTVFFGIGVDVSRALRNSGRP